MRFISPAAASLFMAAFLSPGCRKSVSFTYKASCTECKISYYDERGFFIAQQPAAGIFEKQMEVPEFSNIMIAVQSFIHPDSAAGNPIFASDVIWVQLFKGNNLICADTAVGKKLQAVTCSYDWPK